MNLETVGRIFVKIQTMPVGLFGNWGINLPVRWTAGGAGKEFFSTQMAMGMLYCLKSWDLPGWSIRVGRNIKKSKTE
ncbi:hypothetical protein HCR_07900 [Hydrogenimonas cancrithermarum]|uniref:Uncharacterized protein n=1 Tax=Hydrogenimonas cancrithermarum TaxID=2993563 RepID=A0ABM8FLC0_9BACT|nr:hypothetical protein HCR_07900 [Hydrogenimonas cancrithermarum]